VLAVQAFTGTLMSTCRGKQTQTCASRSSKSVLSIRLSNAPVVRLGLVLNLSDERSGISTEAAESGRGGEAGWGV
jgi:hypothetical protein